MVEQARLYIEEYDTGETTDSYADALDWDTRGFGEKTIILSNTHSSNSLKYKVLVRAEYGSGQDIEKVTETTLVAGDKNGIVLNDAYARVKVQVKAATPGNQATWQCDYVALPSGCS